MFSLTNLEVRPEPRPYRFITVIGNVGAGKTTITRGLAETLGYDASFEQAETNPYLADYYRDQKAWGFHLQVSFLGQRYRDIAAIQGAGRDHVQDRSIYEDVEIFARALYERGQMSARDYETYRGLFESMVPHLIKPDLAICLTGSLETILRHIAQRGREAEKAVPAAYWADLQQRYEGFMADYSHSPVLWVDIDRFDMMRHPEHLHLLAGEVSRVLEGRHSLAAG